MIKILNFLFEGKPAALIFLLCFTLVVFNAIVDYLTGYELTYFIFYILPVLIAAWYGGRVMGSAIALIAAIAWLYTDLLDGHPYSQLWYAYWNGTVRFSFFMMTVQLASSVREHLDLEKAMAREDELTGAPNRLAFKEKCDVLFPLANRNQTPMALGYLDMDNFKLLNDRYGHGFGDKVLKTVAETVIATVRKSDVVGRVGGDEFAVLLPNTDADTARHAFENLHRLLTEKARMFGWPTGFSLGVAVIENPEIATDQALQLAHTLMHQAKLNGKNRVVCDEFYTTNHVG